MRKLLFFIIVAIFICGGMFTSCSSPNEKKAKKLIEEYAKEDLTIYASTYKPVSFSQLDSLFTTTGEFCGWIMTHKYKAEIFGTAVTNEYEFYLNKEITSVTTSPFGTRTKNQISPIENTIDVQDTQSKQVMSPEDCFEQGEKCFYDDKNYVEAEKWYRKSAEQGYAQAQYQLGAMYYDGKEIKQDFSEALKWIRKSAEQGNADAQLILGHMYYLGDGVTENLSEAVKWYRKSAEQGDKYAQYNLGQMYEQGDGVEQDFDKAIKWYQKASDQGHKKASDALLSIQREFYGLELEE